MRVYSEIKRLQTYLASRRLFDNWISFLLRYVLAKYGISVKLVARTGSCIYEISPKVFRMLIDGVSRNVIKSIKCADGRLLISGIGIETIDISELPVNPKSGMRVLGAVYDQGCRCWVVRKGARFRDIYGPIIETFFVGEYSAVNVANNVVIDVGAFVGDTAVYFAFKGARKVIAVEPHPDAYAEMLENIGLNRLESVIVPVNAGLASKPGMLCVADTDVRNTTSVYHGIGDCRSSIPAMTLGELLDKFGLRGDIVLKMDCEGCERDVILNDYEHVSLFDELIFEYHSSPDELIMALSRDYRCMVTGSSSLGIAYCMRRR